MDKNKLKILIVEDEVITAEDIRESLKLIGYENVDVSYTDVDALRMSVKNSYDLILMDVRLNGSKHDGIELAKIINNNIPIIYCTAYSDKDTINRILHSPHLSYILKPFEVRKINEIIDAIL